MHSRRSISSTISVGLVAIVVASCADGHNIPGPNAMEASYNVGDVAGPRYNAGPSANLSLVPGPGQQEFITNGSFESNGGANSGSFAGWAITNTGNGGIFAQTGTATPPPFVTSSPPPPAGSFAAMSSQGGPGSHILHQIVTLPASGTDASFQVKVWYHMWASGFFTPNSLSETVFPNEQFRIDIMNPSAPLTDMGAGILLNVFRTKVGDPAVLPGYITVNANLGAFAGQSIRIRIAEVDNQSNFHASVDDVSLVASVNQPPAANAGPDQTVECTGATTAVTLAGVATDPDNNIASIEWFEGATPIGSGATPTVNLAHGSHTLTLVVTDAFGMTASDDVVIDVVDTTAPTLSVTATPGELWPPNHQYVPVTLTIGVSDNCDGAAALTVTATAVSNEPDDANGNGDGNTTGDVRAGSAMSSNAAPTVSFNPLTQQLELRAERGGRAGGREYTITVTATDSHGNSTTRATTVKVAHNQ